MDIPSRLGKYRIITPLGEGASGCVLKAEQDIIHRIVALKILFPHLTATRPLMVRRFQREARLASSLIHPSIVPIFEIDEENGMHYYSMQYVAGTQLNEYIQKGNLSFENRLRIFLELCDALALAHQRGIVHRDLKPHNVMITPELHPVILDFGIAKSIVSVEEDMTQVGHILGSAHYMAPEQAGTGDIGTHTDVFGLGVMMYEMFTGERPFQGSNIKELIIQRIEYAKAPETFRLASMRNWNPKIPVDMDRIVFRCLEANPKNRYATAGDLLQDLQKVYEGYLIKYTDTHKILKPVISQKTSYRKPLIVSLILLLISVVFSLYGSLQYFENKPKAITIREWQIKAQNKLNTYINNVRTAFYTKYRSEKQEIQPNNIDNSEQDTQHIENQIDNSEQDTQHIENQIDNSEQDTQRIDNQIENNKNTDKIVEINGKILENKENKDTTVGKKDKTVEKKVNNSYKISKNKKKMQQEKTPIDKNKKNIEKEKNNNKESN